MMDACLVLVVTEMPELSLEILGMPERDVVEWRPPRRRDQQVASVAGVAACDSG
jgi:hypothetical protein